MLSSKNINPLIHKIRCPNCRKKVIEKKSYYYCILCKEKIHLPYSKIKYNKKINLGEKIFEYPKIYNLKIKFLNQLNRLSIPLDPYIKDRTILDIGCGSYQVRYNPHFAKHRAGIDPSVKALIHAQKIYPASLHVVGSADKLPFANKSFDVSLLLFTLHHLTKSQWEKALNEAIRVTKKSIIVYDHVSSDSKVLRFLQRTYWKIFDGGHTYPQIKEWTNNLKGLKVTQHYQVGSLFKHICFYKIDL